jgi:hypothetical protein
METVLEVCTAEQQRSVVLFLWAKELNAKDVHKDMFPVYGGKCLSRKAVHNWVEKRDKRFADDEEVETEVRNWLRQQSKKLLCCGFRSCGKAMGQVYQCWWRICREINCFPRFQYHMFYVSYPFVTYLLTLPPTSPSG